ncbi:MAG: condensation domain-containing protein [Bacteroidales bacterium]|nr:condensation domain-containing protein [Bacteroidales bacterium]
MWDKLHFILGSSTDRMIRVSLWYDGLIQLDILKKALGHVTGKNPILHCSFRNHPLRPYWKISSYSIDDILSTSVTNDPEQAKHQFFRQVISVESNVQYRIALINHDGKSLLCLIINHMCTDGVGVQIFLNQLATTYNRIREERPLPEILNGSRAHSKIYAGLTFWNRLTAGFLLNNISRVKEKRTFAYTPKEPSDDLVMVSAKWNMEWVLKIREAAKKNGATVNDLLLSFFTQALYQTCEYQRDRPLTITCMVDNRRHIPDKESTGLTNHVGLMQVRTERCGITIGDTVKQMIKITTREKKKRFFGLAGIPLIRLGYYLPFFMVKPGTLLWFLNPVLGFSNMGVINGELFKMGNLNIVEGLFFGSEQYKPYFSVCIQQVSNSLNFATAIRGSEQDREKIQQLFDTMERFMQEFVSNHQPAAENLNQKPQSNRILKAEA